MTARVPTLADRFARLDVPHRGPSLDVFAPWRSCAPCSRCGWLIGNDEQRCLNCNLAVTNTSSTPGLDWQHDIHRLDIRQYTPTRAWTRLQHVVTTAPWGRSLIVGATRELLLGCITALVEAMQFLFPEGDLVIACNDSQARALRAHSKHLMSWNALDETTLPRHCTLLACCNSRDEIETLSAALERTAARHVIALAGQRICTAAHSLRTLLEQLVPSSADAPMQHEPESAEGLLLRVAQADIVRIADAHDVESRCDCWLSEHGVYVPHAAARVQLPGDLSNLPSVLERFSTNRIESITKWAADAHARYETQLPQQSPAARLDASVALQRALLRWHTLPSFDVLVRTPARTQ